jgi:hypothetical protein
LKPWTWPGFGLSFRAMYNSRLRWPDGQEVVRFDADGPGGECIKYERGFSERGNRWCSGVQGRHSLGFLFGIIAPSLITRVLGPISRQTEIVRCRSEALGVRSGRLIVRLRERLSTGSLPASPGRPPRRWSRVPPDLRRPCLLTARTQECGALSSLVVVKKNIPPYS